MCYKYEWFEKSLAAEKLRKSKEQVDALVKQAKSEATKPETRPEPEKQPEQEVVPA